MTELATCIKAIAPFLWEGRGTISNDNDHYLEIRHPDYPLVLGCRIIRRDWNRVISISAALPRNVAGDYYRRNLGSYTETGKNTPYQAEAPKRSISISRFGTSPERVAREIERHIADPAKPLSLLALKAVAERHALEHKHVKLTKDLAETYGLHFYQHGGCAMYLSDPAKRYDPQCYGTFRIDKNGYTEINIRSMSAEKLTKLIDWLCAGGEERKTP